MRLIVNYGKVRKIKKAEGVKKGRLKMRKYGLNYFLEISKAKNTCLSEVFITEEIQESGRSRVEIWEEMRQRMMLMKNSLNKGIEAPQYSKSGFIKGGAYKLNSRLKEGITLIGEAFTRLLVGAMAVSEVNACMGKIVAAPTAGSCGILPAVLFTVATEQKVKEDKLIRALFTAGGIGLVIEELATLSGAEGGCQAECGAASAMAAGGVVEMMDGAPQTVGHAVAFALKNLLGLICDPVGGLVEVPCVKRNALGAVNAIAAAEMALAGLTSIFSPDQVIEAMGNVGRRLPEEFRETAGGGLAGIKSPQNDDK